MMLSAKNKERNLPCQPCNASSGRDIGDEFIYSCRTKALGKAKQEETGLNEERIFAI